MGLSSPVGVVGHARRLGTERLQDGRDALPVADPGRADRGQAGEDLRQVGLEHALGHADDPGRAFDPQRDVDRGAGARAVALRLAGAGEPEVFGRPGVAPRVGPVHEADDAPFGIADRQQQAGLAGDRQGAMAVAVEAGDGQEPIASPNSSASPWATRQRSRSGRLRYCRRSASSRGNLSACEVRPVRLAQRRVAAGQQGRIDPVQSVGVGPLGPAPAPLAVTSLRVPAVVPRIGLELVDPVGVAMGVRLLADGPVAIAVADGPSAIPRDGAPLVPASAEPAGLLLR